MGSDLTRKKIPNGAPIMAPISNGAARSQQKKCLRRHKINRFIPKLGSASTIDAAFGSIKNDNREIAIKPNANPLIP